MLTVMPFIKNLFCFCSGRDVLVVLAVPIYPVLVSNERVVRSKKNGGKK